MRMQTRSAYAGLTSRTSLLVLHPQVILLLMLISDSQVGQQPRVGTSHRNKSRLALQALLIAPAGHWGCSRDTVCSNLLVPIFHQGEIERRVGGHSAGRWGSRRYRHHHLLAG